MLSYLFFPVGLFLLIKGGGLLVNGATALARRLNVSDLVIGLTVVAFGTSLPEFSVTFISALEGSPQIAMGNVIGSNIANVLLILGLAALIRPLQVSRGTVYKEIPFSLLAALILGFLAGDALLDGSSEALVSRSDGLVLLSVFSIFLYYAFSIAKKGEGLEEGAPAGRMSKLRSLVYIGSGLAGLIVGGQWVTSGAVAVAGLLGMSQSLIGLTIVAVGTSLPELATSVVAARQGNADIAVGNVVGSNIFNIFFVLGGSSLAHPLPVLTDILTDVGVVVLASSILFGFMFTGRKHTLDRWEGAVFLVLYCAYLAFGIMRG